MVDAGVADALAAFGARHADVASARERAPEPAFEVYAENWDAVQVFSALSTQWRMAAFSGFGAARLVHTGLDYSAIEPVYRLIGIGRDRRAAIFQQIRVMEEAALDALLPE
ncbi:DUF1799 domain-containing protein [Paraburkholderia agricolaris]|uniref:DUF1799 domain-containing protein n=1 Tax=Paraburkholderia agricolaris TaxID=2152888 RepID=A0ABW8ZIS3_9BURK